MRAGICDPEVGKRRLQTFKMNIKIGIAMLENL